jgi:hypothetical protein
MIVSQFRVGFPVGHEPDVNLLQQARPGQYRLEFEAYHWDTHLNEYRLVFDDPAEYLMFLLRHG